MSGAASVDAKIESMNSWQRLVRLATLFGGLEMALISKYAGLVCLRNPIGLMRDVCTYFFPMTRAIAERYLVLALFERSSVSNCDVFAVFVVESLMNISGFPLFNAILL